MSDGGADDPFGSDAAVDAEAEATSRMSRSWRPTPWWAWTVALLVVGAGALIAAGALLAGAEFGTSLRPRDCDPSPLPGLGAIGVGALATGLALQVARLRWADSFIVWDAGALVLSLPIPGALLVGTLPGVLGCPVARDIAAVDGFGAALVGTAGIALASASAALVGVAIAACAHVGWVSPVPMAADAPPGIVELAMQEAEALEQDPSVGRFHGVDSGD